MTEGMGMDMGQIISSAELVQPIGDTVRVHDRPVVLGKEKAGVLPNIRMAHFDTQLLGSILFEKRHGFRREADCTRTAGFRRTYINTLTKTLSLSYFKIWGIPMFTDRI